jgi:hypothetical protein
MPIEPIEVFELKDLGTLVDEPCPLFRAVQVYNLLQNIPHTSPGDGPLVEEEEIGEYPPRER